MTPAAHSPSDLTVRAGDLFAFYGLLMHSIDDELGGEYFGECRIPGKMYSVSDSFPALISSGDPGDVVTGRLWRVPDDEASRRLAVARLDNIEGFHESWDESRCMYVRRRVQLAEPHVTAWVYDWNQPLSGLRPVPVGDWMVERARLGLGSSAWGR